MDVKAEVILPPDQLRLVLELTKKHLPDIEVWAYGSRVRGNPRRYSDLDLVAFTTEEQLANADDLREAFEESDLPIRVDLSVWWELPASFRLRIKRDHAVLQPAADSAARQTGQTRS